MRGENDRGGENSLGRLILVVRGERVILDVDLARIYGVTTKALNQAGKPPWGFSEHGALMAANVLRSKRAIEMSIFVIRACVRLRATAASNAAILRRLAEIDRTLLQHDAALRDVYRRLLPLLAPQPEMPKRRIGF